MDQKSISTLNAKNQLNASGLDFSWFSGEEVGSKNPTKINLGRVLGSIWEGFGAVLGLLSVLLAASWPLFERSKSSFFQALAQNGLQEGFWMDFGSLWEHFGTGFPYFLDTFLFIDF